VRVCGGGGGGVGGGARVGGGGGGGGGNSIKSPGIHEGTAKERWGAETVRGRFHMP